MLITGNEIVTFVIQLQAGSHEQCMNTIIDHMIQIKANGML